METLTEPFERRIADFLRRTRLTPSEFGERAIGNRKFCGDLRRGRSPTLRTADRVLAFMESFDRALRGENDGSRPACVEGHGEAARHAGRWGGPSATGSMVHRRSRVVRRERWSLTLRFTFLDAIPSELVVYNPTGFLITYLQADRALVTEAPA